MTVWYFDAEERAEAKKKFKNLTSMCSLFLLLLLQLLIKSINDFEFCIISSTHVCIAVVV